MARQKKSLPIPPKAAHDPRSQEMIRAWIAEMGLHCSLRVGYWQDQNLDEPWAWGVLLADVVRHVANALQESGGKDPRETIQAIKESLLVEIQKPTSKHKGKFAKE
jgi:hypothetical protein